MKIRIDTSPDKRLVFFIVVNIVALLLNNVVHNLPLPEAVDSLINIGLKVVVGMAFLAQTFVLLNRLNKHLLIFMAAAIFIIIINYSFFPETKLYFRSTIVSFFTFCMTAYLVIYSINDFDLLRKELIKASYFISVILFLFSIATFLGIINFDTYDMAFGYHCLFPSMILLLEYIQNRKFITLVAILVMIVSIILFGSRGPLAALVLFGMFFFIRSLIQKKKYWQVSLISVSAVGLLLSYRYIFIFIGDFMRSQGMYSRTVALLSGETVYLSKRDELYDVLISYIVDDPLTVRGINAEWLLFNSYAHNIILELLYQLGFIIGGIVLVYIGGRAWKTLTFKELDSKKVFCIVLMFSSLLPLLVSASLWTNQMFWMWMAMCANIAKNHNKVDLRNNSQINPLPADGD